jgi:hypothetical protein
MTEQQAAQGGALLVPEIRCCSRRMEASVEARPRTVHSGEIRRLG